MRNYKLGIIGAGNMSNAILNGILAKGVFEPQDILVSDVNEDKLIELEKKDISTTTNNKLLLNLCDFIILAIKPQVANKILSDLHDDADGKKIISIMAGITKKSLYAMLGNVKVTRIMPNTPCLVGEGMCAVDASDFVDLDKQLVLNIFGSLGEVIELPEDKFDAVTSVSGSGPAYVYMFIEGMIKGGVKAGLTEEVAKTLTLQTFRGAVTMTENASDIGQLIKNVCSPGGTTIEAVNHYNDSDLEKIIVEGMEKCAKRSKELSGNA